MTSRLRHTHKMIIRTYTDTILYDDLALSMTPSSTLPSVPFHLRINVSAACRLKISNLSGTVVERISFGANETKFTTNHFSNLDAIVSNYFETGTIEMIAVDDNHQPIRWYIEDGPYGCTFGTLGGYSANIQAQSLGLRTNVLHYCRVSRKAPVSTDMEFTISPGYTGKVFVPVSDFNDVCAPSMYVPTDWEFNCIAKEEAGTLPPK
jgi:hypothetical protein